MATRITALMGIFLLLALRLFADEGYVLYYFERPPYMSKGLDGKITGLMATPFIRAFEKAGISHSYTEIAWKSWFEIALRDKRGLRCAPGIKTPERELAFKFTRTIFRLGKQIGLANKSFAVPEGSTLKDVLSIKGVRVLLKEGFSYGAYIDKLLKDLQPNVVRYGADNLRLALMIQNKRADFMFMSNEEIEVLMQKSGVKKDEFHFIPFPDVQPYEQIRIMCTHDVSDTTIERLNRVIPPGYD